jgi:hypothetical protein
MIAESWKRSWEDVTAFFNFPNLIRKIIHTANAIEALHSCVRKAVQLRGHFPSDEAAMKLIWLMLRNVAARWKSPPTHWHQVKAQLAIQFKERFILFNLPLYDSHTKFWTVLQNIRLGGSDLLLLFAKVNNSDVHMTVK